MSEAQAVETGRILDVDPHELVIGANVRRDTQTKATSKFAVSVRSRGVLEPITVYRDEDGRLVVLRGQRRALVAAKVGTPTGRVPVRIVDAPAAADRAVDQLVENVHRVGMHEVEVCDAVAQLALLGVSVRDIVRQTALTREHVTSALAVADKPATRERMERHSLTLAQAGVLAEFDGDEPATARLLQALERGHGFDHTAASLRHDRDIQRRRAEVAAQLRSQGIPALDDPPPSSGLYRQQFDCLVDANGRRVADPASVPGAVVVLVEMYPDDAEDDPGDESDAEPQVSDCLAQVWIHPDPASVGLRYMWDHSPARVEQVEDAAEDDAARDARAAAEQAAQDAARDERRRVLANNKAWRTAEPVRRAWLADFLRRPTAPAGAEPLICQAITGAPHSLQRAMTDGHPHLRSLLGQEPGTRWDQRPDLADVPARSATMRTLAAVFAAWDDAAGVHTWRNPDQWDAAVMAALIGWGYDAADVERLLITQPDPMPTDATDTDTDEPAEDVDNTDDTATG